MKDEQAYRGADDVYRTENTRQQSAAAADSKCPLLESVKLKAQQHIPSPTLQGETEVKDHLTSNTDQSLNLVENRTCFICGLWSQLLHSPWALCSLLKLGNYVHGNIFSFNRQPNWFSFFFLIFDFLKILQ